MGGVEQRSAREMVKNDVEVAAPPLKASSTISKYRTHSWCELCQDSRSPVQSAREAVVVAVVVVV